jgi:phage gp29-like protein
VSARDKLFAVACDDMPVSGAEVEEAIDAFAHELAEKIRRVVYAQLDDEELRTYMRALDAADLIDPEKNDAT